MKTIKYILILLMTSIVMNGQEVTEENNATKTVREKLKVLKEKYDTDYKSYADNIKLLKDASDLSKKEDLSTVRDSAIAIQNRLTKYCNSQNSIKEVFEDTVNKDSMNAWFDKKSCEKFKEQITTKDKPSPASKDINIMFLNAYNFDFEKTNASSGYMGHINVNFPILKGVTKSGFRVNAGLKKIDYSSTDYYMTEYHIDNRYLNPLGTTEGTADTRYIKQYNKYKFSNKNGSFGGYFQLMTKVFRNFKNLYVHAHAELLVSDATYNTEVTTIQTDTLDVPTDQAEVDALALNRILEYSQSKNSRFYAGYFGVGFTGFFEVTKQEDYSLNYFVQGTFGLTNNQLNSNQKLDNFMINNHSINSDNYLSYNINPDLNKHAFFIVSTYINANYEKIRLFIGAEIRGVFDFAPVHIFYAGINLDLFKIVSAFKSS